MLKQVQHDFMKATRRRPYSSIYEKKFMKFYYAFPTNSLTDICVEKEMVR